MKKIAMVTVLLLLSTLLMQFVWHVAEPALQINSASGEKINLALRRTADALLKEAGDSTSHIPPVEQLAGNAWRVRLDYHFNYGKLPDMLQESMAVHGIQYPYDVAVIRCDNGLLQLGYNFKDLFPSPSDTLSSNGTVPCSDRELPAACYYLKITFIKTSNTLYNMPLAGWFFSALLATALYYLSTRRKRTIPPEKSVTVPDNGLYFGNSSLDVANQVLVCGQVRHALTYREAKLLHLFVRNPDQVLERGFIMDNVWADEGIQVGRSLDMFVSRLRKMLRDDPSVQLVAVHGVGYRLDTAKV